MVESASRPGDNRQLPRGVRISITGLRAAGRAQTSCFRTPSCGRRTMSIWCLNNAFGTQICGTKWRVANSSQTPPRLCDFDRISQVRSGQLSMNGIFIREYRGAGKSGQIGDSYLFVVGASLRHCVHPPEEITIYRGEMRCTFTARCGGQLYAAESSFLCFSWQDGLAVHQARGFGTV